MLEGVELVNSSSLRRTIGPLLLSAGIVTLSIVSFLGVFRYRLADIPADVYEARDDAVITLSHARNLVEYGFIGVNPSGERIEGFSAPLQFWVLAGVYALRPIDYTTFLRWQTVIGTAVLGAVMAGLFLSPVPRGRWTWRGLFVALALIASAQILANSRPFLLWHASGMENVYKNAAIVALLWAFDAMLRTGRLPAWGIAVISLAALTRVDAIVPVGILLGAFVVLWWRRHRNPRVLAFGVASLAPWLLYTVWRRWYFGQWEPNTGIAQSIFVTHRLSTLLSTPRVALIDYFQWLRGVGHGLLALQFAWLPVLIGLRGRDGAARHRIALLVTGGIACIVQYALFGPARMDPARTVTELSLYATVLVPFVLLSRLEFRARDLIAGVVMLGGSVGYARSVPFDRSHFAWDAASGEGTANQAEALATTYDIPRPTLANADLGSVSWRKQFNVIDLGKLGNAVIPRVESPGRYIAQFAKPDIIELHGGEWPCIYADLFSTPGFPDEYTRVAEALTEHVPVACASTPGMMSGVWVRRAVMKNAATPERAFLDAFRPALDLTVLKDELGRCLTGPSANPCAYVGRTVFRFVPELKRAGRYGEVAAVLAGDRRLRAEHASFTSSANATSWHGVLEAFEPVVLKPDRISLFTLVDGTRSSGSTVSIRDQLSIGWRASVPPSARFEMRPASGIGPATITFVARRSSDAVDERVDVPIFAGDAVTPSKTLTVRFKSMTAVGSTPLSGSVDVPPDPIVLGVDQVNIQGWAVDAFDLRDVRVAYMQRGTAVTVGVAHGFWMRPDVAALYPDAHDVFNSGWAFTLDPKVLATARRPFTLHFYAETGDGRTVEIGRRTINDR